MHTGLKLVSINIEGDKHWDSILPFLEKEGPEVLCLQEVFEDQLSKLTSFPYLHFTQNTLRPYWSEPGGVPRNFGTAIASRVPLKNVRDVYYWKVGEVPVFFVNGSPKEKHATHWYGCSVAEVETEGMTFKILTTQFTWTPDGMPDDLQRKDLTTLLTLLKNEGEYALCGDFNIPRIQNELYAQLVSAHTDNIPTSYTCSLDSTYHRTRTTPAWEHVRHYMVDYLLTTPKYYATDVRLQDGVSDHMAIVATLHSR
ncbi:MAG: endonuclease/exonuclease/phosphatase family protein [Candidatus Pacebacteria bacterium]|nr:endonuclease/exonuclease/phosphatase family protein [Candidatus Paceibacterota bacterium]